MGKQLHFLQKWRLFIVFTGTVTTYNHVRTQIYTVISITTFAHNIPFLFETPDLIGSPSFPKQQYDCETDLLEPSLLLSSEEEAGSPHSEKLPSSVVVVRDVRCSSRRWSLEWELCASSSSSASKFSRELMRFSLIRRSSSSRSLRSRISSAILVSVVWTLGVGVLLGRDGKLLLLSLLFFAFIIFFSMKFP